MSITVGLVIGVKVKINKISSIEEFPVTVHGKTCFNADGTVMLEEKLVERTYYIHEKNSVKKERLDQLYDLEKISLYYDTYTEMIGHDFYYYQIKLCELDEIVNKLIRDFSVIGWNLSKEDFIISSTVV